MNEISLYGILNEARLSCPVFVTMETCENANTQYDMYTCIEYILAVLNGLYKWNSAKYHLKVPKLCEARLPWWDHVTVETFE